MIWTCSNCTINLIRFSIEIEIYKTQDVWSKESKKKIKENVINMASNEKFNFNEEFFSEYETEENLWNMRSSEYKDSIVPF